MYTTEVASVDIRIGLEVHVQITKLKSKLFCKCSTDYRKAEPNTLVCPVCLGLPGSLPVVNEEAVHKAIRLCLALRGNVARKLRFDRKHYFYPDLPKNYQITQYLEPICRGGFIELESKKRIRVRRINLEEDPGRIVYPGRDPFTSPYSLIDYNRSGIALLEIVTEPDISSPEEAVEFLSKLRSILEHLDICDCGLEGAMRVDANISISGGERVEVKNIGSISDVGKALLFEITRQRDLLMKSIRVRRETRHWDSIRKITISSRVKEEEEDYRYMPDPNLPAVDIPSELVDELRKTLPELPEERVARLVREYNISRELARVLVSRKILADFFEDTTKYYPRGSSDIAKYLVNDLLNWLKDENLESLYVKVKPLYVARVVEMVDKGIISVRQAKELAEHIAHGEDPEQLIKKQGLTRITDELLITRIAEEVFNEYPRAVRDALVNPRAINYLVGMIMKKTKGRADPVIARKTVLRLLERYRENN